MLGEAQHADVGLGLGIMRDLALGGGLDEGLGGAFGAEIARHGRLHLARRHRRAPQAEAGRRRQGHVAGDEDRCLHALGWTKAGYGKWQHVEQLDPGLAAINQDVAAPEELTGVTVTPPRWSS